MEDPEIVELFWQRDEAAIREAGVKYRAYCAAVRNRKHLQAICRLKVLRLMIWLYKSADISLGS